MDALIFIDTNIFLDFYRYPQGSAVLPILGYIDGNHDKIITGNQIEMEFKKNRQKVILESIGFLKGPAWRKNWGQITVFTNIPVQLPLHFNHGPVSAEECS
ncbi:MAG: PIN domain-containing protein [Sulfuricaulis sp.]|nr:PIN domain-containing protein [Sulfuricaulis sp.]